MPVIPGGVSDVEEEAMATMHKTALCAELKAKPKSSPDKRKLQAHAKKQRVLGSNGHPSPARLVVALVKVAPHKWDVLSRKSPDGNERFSKWTRSSGLGVQAWQFTTSVGRGVPKSQMLLFCFLILIP